MTTRKKQNPSSQPSSIEAILEKGNKAELRALFGFDATDSNEEVLVKFNLWCRWFFPQYFKAEDAPFHEEIDNNNLLIYRGLRKTFTNIVFRGGAKTTRTKLFIGFVIANDSE